MRTIRGWNGITNESTGKQRRVPLLDWIAYRRIKGIWSIARNGGGRSIWGGQYICNMEKIIFVFRWIFRTWLAFLNEFAGHLFITYPSSTAPLNNILFSLPMLQWFSIRIWKWECAPCIYCSLWFCYWVAMARQYHLIANHMTNVQKALGKAYRRWPQRTGKWFAATWNSIRCYPLTPSPTEQSRCE